MVEHLRDLARVNPNRVVVGDNVQELTFATLNERANRVTNALHSQGVTAPAPIGIMAGNSADWATLLFGTSFAGMSPVLISTHLQQYEVHYLVENSQAQALFADEANLKVARAAAKEAGLDDGRVLSIDGPEWHEFLSSGSADEPTTPGLYAAPIFYTSGTTGLPKGTRMSQTPHDVPIDEFIAKNLPLWEMFGITSDAHMLVTGPLYHATPQVSCASTLFAGGRVWIMHRFDPEESLRLIEEHRITSLSVVPTNFVRWLRLEEETRLKYDVSSLRVVSHSAAKCPVDIKYRMIDWFGPVLVDGYGGSELGGLSAITSEEWLSHPGSVGRPLPGFEVRIVDDEGIDVAPGEIGRVFAKNSEGLDISYLGEPEKTASVHLDEWFTLGDMGRVDQDGYLYLADRRVDLIISGGVNIYPAEVEHTLARHPAVEDVAVFGIPDDDWGQQVKAAISLRSDYYPSENLEAEMIEWTKGELAHFKCPKSIDFHESLPRQENGKLARRVLRDPYWVDR